MNGAFQKSPGFPFTAGEFLSALFARVTAILDKKVAGALHVVEHENRRTGHHRIGISIGLRPEIECEIGSRRAASERTSVVFLVCPPGARSTLAAAPRGKPAGGPGDSVMQNVYGAPTPGKCARSWPGAGR